MLITGIILSLIAGLAIPAGAFLANFSFFKKRWAQEELKRCIIGFGAGALFSAIAFVLVPEGYAAFTEMNNGKTAKRKLLAMFVLTGLTGPLYILLGAYVFADMDFILGVMMTFCAGGILYLVFEDIAPRVAIKKHWLPPLGAIGGFMVGMAGYLYIH